MADDKGTEVVYLGSAGVRELSASDLKSVDPSYAGSKLTWSRDNEFMVANVVLSDDLKAFFDNDEDFVVGESALTKPQRAALNDKKAIVSNAIPTAP